MPDRRPARGAGARGLRVAAVRTGAGCRCGCAVDGKRATIPYCKIGIPSRSVAVVRPCGSPPSRRDEGACGSCRPGGAKRVGARGRYCFNYPGRRVDPSRFCKRGLMREMNSLHGLRSAAEEKDGTFPQLTGSPGFKAAQSAAFGGSFRRISVQRVTVRLR